MFRDIETLEGSSCHSGKVGHHAFDLNLTSLCTDLFRLFAAACPATLPPSQTLELQPTTSRSCYPPERTYFTSVRSFFRRSLWQYLVKTVGLLHRELQV